MSLFAWFSLMSFCVQWERELSSLHHVLFGFLQGNLLSLRFLYMYVDSLLCKLECCNKGCKIFRQFLKAIMYADDLLLMSCSIVNLQCMIDNCAEYGLIKGITFSHVKSNCLAIYPYSSYLPFFFIKCKWC